MFRNRLGMFACLCLVLMPISSAMSSATYCNSQQLQGTTCDNPKECWNACAFRCTTYQTCMQCCTAFQPGTYGRTACENECASVPWYP